jgi:Fe-S-cluster containining protein
MFKNIVEAGELFFNDCSSCENNCCATGRISLAPLVINDFEEVYEYFPILFGEIDNTLKAFMMINDGASDCRYLQDGKCTIYDSRPPACKMYPISPFYGDVYVDVDCHAVGDKGDFLCSSDNVSTTFYHKRLVDFPTKLAFTDNFLKTISLKLEFVTKIKNTDIELFKYVGNAKNQHIEMHLKSLDKLL